MKKALLIFKAWPQVNLNLAHFLIFFLIIQLGELCLSCPLTFCSFEITSKFFLGILWIYTTHREKVPRLPRLRGRASVTLHVQELCWAPRTASSGSSKAGVQSLHGCSNPFPRVWTSWPGAKPKAAGEASCWSWHKAGHRESISQCHRARTDAIILSISNNKCWYSHQ